MCQKTSCIFGSSVPEGETPTFEIDLTVRRWGSILYATLLATFLAIVGLVGVYRPATIGDGSAIEAMVILPGAFIAALRFTDSRFLSPRTVLLRALALLTSAASAMYLLALLPTASNENEPVLGIGPLDAIRWSSIVMYAVAGLATIVFMSVAIGGPMNRIDMMRSSFGRPRDTDRPIAETRRSHKIFSCIKLAFGAAVLVVTTVLIIFDAF